jgi:uncharacterized protein YbjT (DUF2867 family)
MEAAEKINVVITGASGMVGEGVLLTCLQHVQISKILVIGRKTCGIIHPKLTEIIHADFTDLSAIASQLNDYQACFFCAGISSVGVNEEAYTKITYTLTLRFAESLAAINPDMTFEYISGSGTDSTEKGKLMWARVKGKTENDLQKFPFKAVYSFRPGFILSLKGQKNVLKLYKYLGWLFPLLNRFSNNLASTMQELAIAMINAALFGYVKPVVEVKDILFLAGKS